MTTNVVEEVIRMPGGKVDTESVQRAWRDAFTLDETGHDRASVEARRRVCSKIMSGLLTAALGGDGAVYVFARELIASIDDNDERALAADDYATLLVEQARSMNESVIMEDLQRPDPALARQLINEA